MHSSSHDKRRSKRIERELKTAKAKAQKACKQSSKETYQCHADAERSLKRLQQDYKGKLWEVTGEIEEVKKYSPGRLPAEGERPVKSISDRLKTQFQENTELSAKRQERAGCFVLLTNTKKQAEIGELSSSARECLTNYKEQHGVERNFSFLKDPLIVNDTFLKSPNESMR